MVRRFSPGQPGGSQRPSARHKALCAADLGGKASAARFGSCRTVIHVVKTHAEPPTERWSTVCAQGSCGARCPSRQFHNCPGMPADHLCLRTGWLAGKPSGTVGLAPCRAVAGPAASSSFLQRAATARSIRGASLRALATQRGAQARPGLRFAGRPEGTAEEKKKRATNQRHLAHSNGGGASLGETRLTRIFPVRRESTGKLARCARARTDLIPGTAGTSGPFAVRCLAANFASRELTGNSPALFGAAPHPCSPDPTRASSSIT
jgi:hypothetical protein